MIYARILSHITYPVPYFEEVYKISAVCNKCFGDFAILISCYIKLYMVILY